ncbi:hypothetical protein [Actinocorallia longicatena]|uniref:Uncharacterized protein n=1 Tax=Actinocorallia longicatena TaxID=111803 RepID=A0ABP6QF33_9ACTN
MTTEHPADATKAEWPTELPAYGVGTQLHHPDGGTWLVVATDDGKQLLGLHDLVIRSAAEVIAATGELTPNGLPAAAGVIVLPRPLDPVYDVAKLAATVKPGTEGTGIGRLSPGLSIKPDFGADWAMAAYNPRDLRDLATSAALAANEAERRQG